MIDIPTRKIYISGEIDEELTQGVIEQIHAINDYDEMMKEEDSEHIRYPIEMYVNSVGGSATDGFSIVYAMEASETPIMTISLGMVASVALAIFLAGDIRLTSRYTRFMYHAVAYMSAGQLEEHKEGVAEAEVLQGYYDDLIVEKTDFTYEELQEVKTQRANRFFSPEFAVTKKVAHLIDDVIDKDLSFFEAHNEEEGE